MQRFARTVTLERATGGLSVDCGLDAMALIASWVAPRLPDDVVTFQAETAYPAGTWVEFGGTRWLTPVAGTSGESEPVDEFVFQGLTWDLRADDIGAWEAETMVDASAYILVDGGRIFTTAAGGETGEAEPDWDDEQPITDGTVEWTEVLPWEAEAEYGEGDEVTGGGLVWQALAEGTSGTVEPDWSDPVKVSDELVVGDTGVAWCREDGTNLAAEIEDAITGAEVEPGVGFFAGPIVVLTSVVGDLPVDVHVLAAEQPLQLAEAGPE